jgi:peptide deformylase
VARRGIRLFGDPVLRAHAKPVDARDASTRELVSDLFETMRAAKGVGLAANQIGVASRVFVVDCSLVVPDGPQLALCNPERVSSGSRGRAEEGCLSFPSLYLQVNRDEVAHLRYETTEGVTEEIKAEGLVARVLLHELDHLNGVLYIDGQSTMRRVLLAPRLNKFTRRQQQGDTA